MKNANPLNLIFRDAKKLDMQNPIIGKFSTQVKASELTEDQLTRIILMQDQIYDIENRLEKLKHLIRRDSDNDGGGGGSGGGGGGDGGLLQTPLLPTPVRKYTLCDVECDMENLTEILSKIGDEKPFEFEFFTGGENKKFDDTMRSYGLSTDNLEFLDFLQSEICKKILTTNKLKIHVETGNIYYDNNDTSKSIFDFFLKEQDPTKGIIEHDFVYGGSYNDYFQWLIDGFDSQEKTKLDVLTSKNAKFFFYRMNEVLQANNLPLKKVKHSVVTEDYIAIEKIHSRNWQYFVEFVLEACRRKNSGETVYQHQSKLIRASIENVTKNSTAKKTYKSSFNQIINNLTFMFDNLPDDEFKKIINDLHTKNYLPDDFDIFFRLLV